MANAKKMLLHVILERTTHPDKGVFALIKVTLSDWSKVGKKEFSIKVVDEQLLNKLELRGENDKLYRLPIVSKIFESSSSGASSSLITKVVKTSLIVITTTSHLFLCILSQDHHLKAPRHARCAPMYPPPLKTHLSLPSQNELEPSEAIPKKRKSGNPDPTIKYVRDSDMCIYG